MWYPSLQPVQSPTLLTGKAGPGTQGCVLRFITLALSVTFAAAGGKAVGQTIDTVAGGDRGGDSRDKRLADQPQSCGTRRRRQPLHR